MLPALGRAQKTFPGQLGPILTRFQPFSAIPPHFILVCPWETVIEFDMGPKTVKDGNFQKWFLTPWGGSNGSFSVIWGMS